MVRAKVKLGFGARKNREKESGRQPGCQAPVPNQKGQLVGGKKNCGFPARHRGRQPGCPGPVQIKEGNMSEASKP